jgi:general secretion pathway protein K
MALVAVLWIVAALSVLVTGLILTTRAQIGVVAAGRDAATGQALGDAAIALALQALLADSDRPAGVQTVSVTYADQSMQVEVAPLDGLISLNGASAPLLAALLQGASGLPPAAAQDLAQQLVDWRSEVPPTQTLGAAAGQPRLFEAPEDLLLVPGVDYDLYARIAPLVSADLRSGRVNPQAAPPQVLAALAPGDPGRIAQFIAARAGGQPADSSFLDPSLVGAASSGRFYRLRVSVPLDAGKMLVMTRDVTLISASSSLLPWRMLRQSRQIQLPGAP